MRVEFPLRLGRGGNDRKHWRDALKQKTSEKEATSWALVGEVAPSIPCAITITRISPSNGMDSDNLSGACKYVRDSVAKWLGIDDNREDQVSYIYAQERGDRWHVRIESGPMP